MLQKFAFVITSLSYYATSNCVKIDSDGRFKPNFTTKEMISIVPLRTFHLYIAAFQRSLYLEYISCIEAIFQSFFVCLMVHNATFNNISIISWLNIPEHVVPLIISLIDGYCKQESN